MPATIGSLPVFMRIGEGDELQVGTLDLDAMLVQPDLIVTADLAAMLRSAADTIEHRADDHGHGEHDEP